jgi:DNA polymerase-3 subunit gamma/tau
MSYLVLARKYRPGTFSQMVGQTHVVQALANALQSQRLHHAYLFTGTRGVGKTTVSRILAKSLNCMGADGQGGITAEPCGRCQACLDIDAGRFVDYTELDAASNRGVDEIAQLLEQAVYKPVVGRFKVFMIDEVHMLTNTAFNAMLKTLEEPPDYLKFVLATTDPQKVPATVLSRCLQFNLRPMAPETIIEHLNLVLGQEGIEFEAGALSLLSRAARGSMRDALSLTDQAIAFGAGQLLEAGVRQMLGAVERSHVFELIGALARADGKRVLEICDGLRREGYSADSTLEEMSLVLGRMAVVQAVTDRQDPDPDFPQIAGLARELPADETQLLYSLCLHGRTELALAPDEYAALTMVLLRLLPFKQGAQGSAVAPPKKPESAPVATTQPAIAFQTARPGVVQARPSSDQTAVGVGVKHAVQKAAPSVQSPAATVSAAPPEGEQRQWSERVRQLLNADLVGGLARELALHSELARCDGAIWTLRVERQSLLHEAACEQLLQALQGLDPGRPERLLMELGPVTDCEAMRRAAAQADRQQRAERIIEDDPFVQEMVANWGARIVPGSIKPWSPNTGQPV